MKFYLASYDNETDEQVESIPTTSDVFELVRVMLGRNFNEYADCIEITPDMYKSLRERLDMRLPVNSRTIWYLERFAS